MSSYKALIVQSNIYVNSTGEYWQNQAKIGKNWQKPNMLQNQNDFIKVS